MQIKNKKTETPYSLTYREWRTEYIQNNKYIHFDIVNYNNVVELHVIDKETGELKFSQIIDKKEAENNVRQFSTTQYIKPLSFEYYDKNLVPLKKTSQTDLLFFDRVKKMWKSIPKMKTIYEKIINSPMSKFTSNIINTVIGGLLILLIWAVYEKQLILIWKNIFE